jgi:hypothetical protein
MLLMESDLLLSSLSSKYICTFRRFGAKLWLKYMTAEEII